MTPPSDRLREAYAATGAHRDQVAREEAARVPDLFSPAPAPVEAAGSAWTLATLDVIRRVARERATFTVEHLDGRLPAIVDRRAVGGALLEAQRQGIVRRLGWVAAGAGRHGRPVTEWASLIYRSEP